MDTKGLLRVARRIEALEKEIFRLKNQAKQIVASQGAEQLGRKGKKMSAAARKKISEAMRRRWAAVKKKA